MSALPDQLLLRDITTPLSFGGTINADGSIATITGPSIRTIDIDPSAVGLAANLGSLALRRTAGNVQLWQKTGAADANWTQNGTLAGAVALTGITSTAGALQWTAIDANAAAISIGAAGALNMLVWDTSNGAEQVIVNAGTLRVAGATGAIFNDTRPLRLGTPGTDVVITPDGIDAVVTGTGDMVYADAFDVFWGTAKEVAITGSAGFADLSNAGGAGLFRAHDDTFRIVDDGGVTRVMAFSAGLITAGLTRTLTMANWDTDLRTAGQRALVTIPGGNGAGSVGQLFAAPVQLVAAPGANLFIELISAHVFYDFAAAAYDGVAAGEDLVISYTNAAGVEVARMETTGVLDAVADEHRLLYAQTPALGTATTIEPVENAALVAHILVGSPWAAAGDSPLIIEVYYRLRDLAPV